MREFYCLIEKKLHREYLGGAEISYQGKILIHTPYSARFLSREG
jgi:hypothetical protein